MHSEGTKKKKKKLVSGQKQHLRNSGQEGNPDMMTYCAKLTERLDGVEFNYSIAFLKLTETNFGLKKMNVSPFSCRHNFTCIGIQ